MKFPGLLRTYGIPSAPGFRLPAVLIGLFLVLATALSSPKAGSGQTDSASMEYNIKAVFLYQFTRYLEWPPGTEHDIFSIVVLGESRIIAPLQEIARKKTVDSKPISIRQCFEIEQIGRPRILFISNSADSNLERVLEKIRGTGILIIGETEGLGLRGAAINFVMREGGVKFEMNEKALKDAGIRIGSQLLKLAILVGGKGADGKS